MVLVLVDRSARGTTTLTGNGDAHRGGIVRGAGPRPPPATGDRRCGAGLGPRQWRSALPRVPVSAIVPQIVRTATIDLRVGKNSSTRL